MPEYSCASPAPPSSTGQPDQTEGRSDNVPSPGAAVDTEVVMATDAVEVETPEVVMATDAVGVETTEVVMATNAVEVEPREVAPGSSP